MTQRLLARSETATSRPTGSRCPGVWVHGDWARIDDDGYWYIPGRSDDTIKVAGKRVGPAEVESAAVAHPSVVEAPAIGVPDEIKGESIVLFAVVRDGAERTDGLASEIGETVVEHLGKSFKPGAVHLVPSLPRLATARSCDACAGRLPGARSGGRHLVGGCRQRWSRSGSWAPPGLRVACGPVARRASRPAAAESGTGSGCGGVAAGTAASRGGASAGAFGLTRSDRSGASLASSARGAQLGEPRHHLGHRPRQAHASSDPAASPRKSPRVSATRRTPTSIGTRIMASSSSHGQIGVGNAAAAMSWLQTCLTTSGSSASSWIWRPRPAPA